MEKTTLKNFEIRKEINSTKLNFRKNRKKSIIRLSKLNFIVYLYLNIFYYYYILNAKKLIIKAILI